MKDPATLYESLVREHSRDLYRIAYQLCGNVEHAQDLVQECFIEAWKGIGRLRDASRARAWLVQILRNRWYRMLPRVVRQRTRETVDDTVEGAQPSHEEQTSSEDWTRTALQRLDPQYREAFLLVVMEGFHCREVAEMLEIPIGTVLSRLHRARLRLRAYLEEQEAEASRTHPKVRRLHSSG